MSGILLKIHIFLFDPARSYNSGTIPRSVAQRNLKSENFGRNLVAQRTKVLLFAIMCPIPKMNRASRCNTWELKRFRHNIPLRNPLQSFPRWRCHFWGVGGQNAQGTGAKSKRRIETHRDASNRLTKCWNCPSMWHVWYVLQECQCCNRQNFLLHWRLPHLTPFPLPA